MVLLQLASSLLIVAGLVAIAFGYSLRDATFGHTALVSGLIGFGGGIIAFALAMSVRELRRIATLLDLSVPAPASGALLDLSRTAPTPRAAIAPVAEKSRPLPPITVTGSPHDEVRRFPPSLPPRTRRSDADVRRSGAARADKTIAPPPAIRETLERMEEKPADASPAAVESPPVAATPEPVEAAAPPASADIAPRLVKSGQVNEMTYAIYSDGSIEAALPTGTVRFATINQLRDYLNGGTPSPSASSLV